MEITEVKVFPVREEKLKAFVSVVIDECFMVNDIKIISGKEGLFISMPSRRKKNGKFKDVAHPLNNDTRQRMEEEILSAYRSVAGADEGQPARPSSEARETVRNEDPGNDGATRRREGRAGEVADGREENPSLEEVTEAHLRDSFWGT